MDREVLRAYGWDDLVPRVPPFCIATDADKRALDAFENEAIDRLFALNAKRAEEERVKGVGVAGEEERGRKAAGKKPYMGRKEAEESQLPLNAAATPGDAPEDGSS